MVNSNMTQPYADQLNALLEAERSSVQTLSAMAAELPRGYLRNQFEKVRRDGSTSCAGLAAAIKRQGGIPRRKKPHYTEVVLAQDDLSARLWLLARAYVWVITGLRPLLAAPLDPETLAFLREMLAVHEENVEWCNRTGAALRRATPEPVTDRS
jgi:hypothetical protein